MKLKQAIKILAEHQKWRLGEIENMPYMSKQLTEAINTILKHYDTTNNIQPSERTLPR